MTTKLEQAARQALEALELRANRSATVSHKIGAEIKAITALREALAKQETEWETPWKYNPYNGKRLVVGEIAMAEQAEQEPVAWNNTVDEVQFKEPVIQEPMAWMDGAGEIHKHKLQRDWEPLYAAPVRTKDLTDDEWQQFFNGKGVYLQSEHAGEVARAVIAADREKNK